MKHKCPQVLSHAVRFPQDQNKVSKSDKLNFNKKIRNPSKIVLTTGENQKGFQIPNIHVLLHEHMYFN